MNGLPATVTTEIAPEATQNTTGVDFDTIRMEDMPTSIRVCEQNIQMNGWLLGGMLISAKKRVAHGDFMNWLKTHTDISQATANNLMALHNGVQETPFLAEMKQSAAVMLLALAPDQRKQYADEHDVNAMSVRQLREDIERMKTDVQRQLEAEQAKHARELAEATASLEPLKSKAAAYDQAAMEALAARKEAQRITGMYETVAEQLEESRDRQAVLEKELSQQPISITTVEVEKPVEVIPEDYEQMKKDLQAANKFADAAEQRLKEMQANVAMQATRQDSGEIGLSCFQRATTDFLGRATLQIAIGNTFTVADDHERAEYLACVAAVEQACGNLRRVIDAATVYHADDASVV